MRWSWVSHSSQLVRPFCLHLVRSPWPHSGIDHSSIPPFSALDETVQGPPFFPACAPAREVCIWCMYHEPNQALASHTLQGMAVCGSHLNLHPMRWSWVCRSFQLMRALCMHLVYAPWAWSDIGHAKTARNGQLFLLTSSAPDKVVLGLPLLSACWPMLFSWGVCPISQALVVYRLQGMAGRSCRLRLHLMRWSWVCHSFPACALLLSTWGVCSISQALAM